VFKNCEGLIEQEKQLFIDLMLDILTQLDNCKIILITTQRLEQSNEELIIIQNLTKVQAVKLFR
jgi:hypothetical protein